MAKQKTKSKTKKQIYSEILDISILYTLAFKFPSKSEQQIFHFALTGIKGYEMYDGNEEKAVLFAHKDAVEPIRILAKEHNGIEYLPYLEEQSDDD